MSLEDWRMLTIGPILSNLPVNQQVSIIPQLVVSTTLVEDYFKRGIGHSLNLQANGLRAQLTPWFQTMIKTVSGTACE